MPEDHAAPSVEAESASDAVFLARVYIDDPTVIEREGLDVEFSCCPHLYTDEKGTWVHARMKADRLKELAVKGMKAVCDEKATADFRASERMLAAARSGDATAYRKPAAMYADMRNIANAHPGICQIVDYGDSVKKMAGTGGFDLLACRVTNRSRPGPKPVFFLEAGMHGNEIAQPELVMFFLDYLAKKYGQDADVTWLVDWHEIWLVPVCNPDGREAVKRANANGVDLNRNFGYPGMTVPTQPETRSLLNLWRSVFPDRKEDSPTSLAPLDTMGLMLDMHDYGSMTSWPWGYIGSAPPNHTGLKAISDKFGTYNGYRSAQAYYNPYPHQSPSYDRCYGELGVASFLFELDSRAPPYDKIDSVLWPKMLPCFLYAAKIARSPYLTAHGPDALSVSALPNGTTLQVSATINDQKNGGHAIAAAECYFDVPPWAAGAQARSLSASDGSFNSPLETVTAALNIGALSSGRHVLFVRGRDTMGQWGPFSAAFFVAGPGGINEEPVIDSSPWADPNPVTLPAASTVHVVAFDPDNGPSALTCTWSKVSGPGTVSFSPNGTAGSASSTASFATSGSYVLKVSVADGAAATTDTVAVTVHAASSSGDLIVDNKDTNTSRTGQWATSSGTNPWSTGSLYSDTAGSTFRWIPNVPAPGVYQIYAWWSAHTNRNTNAPYTITHAGGSNVVRVDQKLNAGQWNLLGTYTFNAGSSGWVEVAHGSGNATCADAVKLVPQAAPPPPDGSLVAHWKLDDGSGTSAADSSGNGRAGTLHGNPAWVSGKLGQGVRCHGDGDWLEFPEVVDMKAQAHWSVAMWFKLDALPSASNDMFLWKYTDTGPSKDVPLYVDNDNRIKAFNGAKLSTGVTVQAGTWYHVAGVRDGSAYRIYVNGELKASSANFGFATDGASCEVFKADGRAWGHGTVDDLRVYAKSLSATEAAELAQAGP